MTATRYHSLIVEESSLPAELEVSAYTTERDGSKTIMGLRHRKFPVEGVQFHPESVLTTAGKKLVENFHGDLVSEIDGYNTGVKAFFRLALRVLVLLLVAMISGLTAMRFRHPRARSRSAERGRTHRRGGSQADRRRTDWVLRLERRYYSPDVGERGKFLPQVPASRNQGAAGLAGASSLRAWVSSACKS